MDEEIAAAIALGARIVPCEECGTFTPYPTPWDAIVGYEWPTEDANSPERLSPTRAIMESEEMWRCGFFLCSESCAQRLCDKMKEHGDPQNPALKVDYANVIKSVHE